MKRILFGIALLWALVVLLAACGSDGAVIKAPSFEIDGKNLFISVSNNTETFSFIDQIKVGKNGTWQISTDIYGMNTIPSKTAPLNVGDNIFYLMVTLENDVDLYTINVRRRPIYIVSFNTANGTAVASQQVEEDSLATKPNDPERKGNTFEGWDYDFENPIMANTQIIANWKEDPALAPFNYSSSATTCEITGIKYKTVTDLVIPDYVTSIESGAFSGCSELTNIYYQGTEAEWNAIAKGRGWNNHTGNYTIYFNDESSAQKDGEDGEDGEEVGEDNEQGFGEIHLIR